MFQHNPNIKLEDEYLVLDLSIAEKAHQDAAAATNPREADVETIERLVIESITRGR